MLKKNNNSPSSFMLISNLFCLLLILFSITALNAQSIERSVVSTAGGYGGNALVTVDWTMGETLMERTSISGLHLTQGFQQPFSVVPSHISRFTPITEIHIYPNPFLQTLMLEGAGIQMLDRVEIFDVSGRLVFQQTIQPGSHSVDVHPGELTSGVYQIRLLGAGKLLAIEKLIKN